MLVSTVQQSESVTFVHISPLFWVSFPFRLWWRPEWCSCFMHLVLITCLFLYIVVYMSVPISQFIPPPSPLGVHTFILYLSVCFCFANVHLAAMQSGLSALQWGRAHPFFLTSLPSVSSAHGCSTRALFWPPGPSSDETDLRDLS